MLRRSQALVIIAVITLILGCSRNASAQKPKAETISFADLLRLFTDQPEHMADRTIVIDGSPIQMKFARKLDKTRQEFYPLDGAGSLKNDSYRNYKIITIGKLNQPTIAIDPQEKTYAEAPENFSLVPFDIESFLRNASAELRKIKAENVGTETIDGHKASKIRLRFEGSTEEMCFYFANDLKNLFIKMDSGSIKQIKGSYTVSNVSFDVPDDLFEIPGDYKKVDFNSMISTIRQKALK